MTQPDFMSNPELCTKEFLQILLAAGHKAKTEEEKIKALVQGDEGSTFRALSHPLRAGTIPLTSLPEPGRTEFLKIAAEQEVMTHTSHESQEALHYCGLLFGMLPQTEESCILVVRADPWMLPYVKEQTPKICWEAVRRDGMVLQFVKDQTEEICLEAVHQKGKALKHVKKQTTKIIVTAIKEDHDAIKFVDEELMK